MYEMVSCMLFLFCVGMFSDTHVLALMYAGEMSYWLVSHFQPPDEAQHTQLTQQCDHFLSTYIAVTEGPLKQHGWSTARAKQILSEVLSQKHRKSPTHGLQS